MNSWNEFRKLHKGSGLTVSQISQMYGGGKDGKAKAKLRRYLVGLYRLLGRTETCFLSGAFVIDDHAGMLRQILLNSKDTTLKGPLLSHTGFGPYKSGSCGGVCEVHIPEFQGKCGTESRLFTNVKWYTFNNTSTKSTDPERYIYLKLEQTKTFSTKHIKNAGTRYILKRQVYESPLPKRREDCHKDHAGCKCSIAGCPNDPTGFHVQDTCTRNVHTHERVGDEFFIPESVNYALVMDQPVDICHVDDV